jgi:NAD(P)-dependent dehydrogenase (short-subunit alcohol dehydrogenase family)
MSPVNPAAAPRTILIAGASSGIGRSLAEQLAGEGARLALLARREPLLRGLAEVLPGGAGRHFCRACDLTRPLDVAASVAASETALGPIGAAVYCAGSARIAPVEETTDEAWQEMLGANLSGLFYLSRAFLPLWKQRGEGHLLAVLSISSTRAFPGWSAYTAAKFGALGFVECLRAEGRKSGIHVTALLPGATDTPIWDRLGEGWDRSRMMPPEEVARLAATALRERGRGMIEEIRIAPAGGNL